MKNEKLLYLFALVFFLFVLKTSVFAQSNYVLPYPSSMPGSFSYKIHLIYESVSKYWYFGDFGQFDYNLKLADKYLVEAKILFEYKQYLLGYKALEKSNRYFVSIPLNLAKAKENDKDISQRRKILEESAQKHIEILSELQGKLPPSFLWTPENAKSTNLNLEEMMGKSIKIRASYL